MPWSSSGEPQSLLETFERVFNTDIAPRLEQLEEKRLALRQRLFRNWLLTAGVVIVTAVVGFWITPHLPPLFFALFLGAAMIWLFIYEPYVFFLQGVKQEILPPLCEALGFSYEDFPETDVADYFSALNLVGRFDQSHIEEKISGHYRGQSVSLYEARLERNEKQSRRTQSSSRTIFHGLLLRFELHRTFHGRTLILQQGRAARDFMTEVVGELQQVHFHDPGLERRYDFYTTDVAEAESLISSAFLESLAALESRLNAPIQLAFDRGRLLAAVTLGRDAFNVGGLKRPLADKTRLRDIAVDLAMIFDIAYSLRIGRDANAEDS